MLFRSRWDMHSRDIPPHLHDRYGITPPSPWRWVAWAAAALVVIPTGIYAASRYVVTQSAPYTLTQWAARPDGLAVDVTFSIQSSPVTRWCSIRAQNIKRFDVGFAVLRVPPGIDGGRATLTTLSSPIAVTLVDCDTDPYSLPGPQFAPGVRPPVQAAPLLTPGVHAPEELKALQ